MREARRLKGHKAAATCCVASKLRAGLLITAAEDGGVCFHDLRCKDVLFTFHNQTSVSSLCFNPGNEDIIYVSAGNEVKCYDSHMLTTSWKLLESYNYSEDEINQIACNSRSSFLAAADDTGDVKIIDIHQRCLYKTLRAGHNSICSSIQFLPWTSWEVITGGLDSKLVMWDFSKGRSNKIMDFGMNGSYRSFSILHKFPLLPNKMGHMYAPAGSEGGAGQSYNPAFIHALAVPDIDMVDKVGKTCAVARGDGVVNVINLDKELAVLKSNKPVNSKLRSKSKSKSGNTSGDPQSQYPNNSKLHLDYTLGGHVAAVSSVTFSTFGEKGKFVISGGNDKSVKVWDWSKTYDAGKTISGDGPLSLNISLSRKVNWLCTTPSDSENLVVCDTSKVVKVYTIG